MKTILLIEDNDEMRENTAEILELSNYQVLTAANGKIGVELAQKNKPDLIVCDVMMPVLDGYGVLHMLGKNNETAGIPFIFLTAKAERSDMRKGMEMGADDYLTKPFDDMELLKAVESRIKKSEWLRQDYASNLEGLDKFIEHAKGLEELKKLTGETITKHYKKKDTVFNEYSNPNGLYFIKKGKVKVSKINPDGKEFITGLYNEGEFFGYLALLEGSNYNDNAVVIEEAEICLISRDDFFSLIHSSREVANKFIEILTNHLSEKEDQLLKLAYNSVRKRVAEALVQLQIRYQKAKAESFSMNISREDLGNLAGTSTESAIRTLSDFKDEHLVEIKGGNITILDFDKLSRMKN